jgi:hypothetical protein
MANTIGVVGEPISADRPASFKLVIGDHVQYINPLTYGINIKGVNPADYFVTSGDAVEKSHALERDMWNMAWQLQKLVIDTMVAERKCDRHNAIKLYDEGVRTKQPKLNNCEQDVWAAVLASQKMRQALIEARGSDIFLETEWGDHTLLVIPKNPRRQ